MQFGLGRVPESVDGVGTDCLILLIQVLELVAADFRFQYTSLIEPVHRKADIGW